MRVTACSGRAALGLVLWACAWVAAQDVAPPKVAASQPAATEKTAASQPADRVSGGPRLEISSTVVDFGEVWQGEPAQGEVTLKNVGDAPLVITSVKTSCGCTMPSKPKSPLQPGESTTLSISYDSVKRRGRARQRVTVFTNDPHRPNVGIAVQGNVKSLYKAIPAEGITFSRMTRDERRSQSIKLQNEYEGPLELRLREGQDFGPFEIKFEEIRPGAEFELTATTKPPMPEGVTRIEVRLETGLPHARQLQISVHANVSLDVICRPYTLLASRRAIVATQRDVWLIYRMDKPVKITEVRPSDQSIRYEVMPPKPHRGSEAWFQQQVRVTLPPGEQLPLGDAYLEILTDSTEPRFQKFHVAIDVVEPQAVRSKPACVPPKPAPPVKPGKPQDEKKL